MKVLKLKIGQIACLLGIALVVLGIFSPWAKWPTWGRYLAGSVSGMEVADGWIFLVFVIVAAVSTFKSLSDVGIGFLRLFPGVILFLGGWLNAEVFQGFAYGRVPFGVAEKGMGSYLVMVGGLIILISGLWEFYIYLKMYSL
jgi:hypothetical protein